jgi:hypothetical protein
MYGEVVNAASEVRDVCVLTSACLARAAAA